MTRKRERDVVAEAQRLNEQSSYTRSWQVSPLGGPHGLRLRGAARSLPRLLLAVVVVVIALSVALAILHR
jgi:hypothetical protein